MTRKIRAASIPPSQITPEELFVDRRRAMQLAFAAGALAGLGHVDRLFAATAAPADRFNVPRNVPMSITDLPNTWEQVTSYNNFYEFGTDKEDPAANASTLKPSPWSLTIDGECEVKGKFNLEDILKAMPLEERVYRLRCVEAWSMVVPWVGFPLVELIKRHKPTSKARYVEFKTLLDPQQMPGERRRLLDWPYTEGLRIDEASHPLALLAVGIYGRMIPNQNGAPIRLVVPWKYGFKGIKSIVSIRFVEQQPKNTWQVSNPGEYGFYANVNPAVDHPRWSQASERLVGSVRAGRRDTQPFNGYAEQVASLYAGMDLRRNF